MVGQIPRPRAAQAKACLVMAVTATEPGLTAHSSHPNIVTDTPGLLTAVAGRLTGSAAVFDSDWDMPGLPGDLAIGEFLPMKARCLAHEWQGNCIQCTATRLRAMCRPS